VRRVRCLVVVPVGDLAAQVHKVFLDYCQHTNLRVSVYYLTDLFLVVGLPVHGNRGLNVFALFFFYF